MNSIAESQENYGKISTMAKGIGEESAINRSFVPLKEIAVSKPCNKDNIEHSQWSLSSECVRSNNVNMNMMRQYTQDQRKKKGSGCEQKGSVLSSCRSKYKENQRSDKKLSKTNKVYLLTTSTNKYV